MILLLCQSTFFMKKELLMQKVFILIQNWSNISRRPQKVFNNIFNIAQKLSFQLMISSVNVTKSTMENFTFCEV